MGYSESFFAHVWQHIMSSYTVQLRLKSGQSIANQIWESCHRYDLVDYQSALNFSQDSGPCISRSLDHRFCTKFGSESLVSLGWKAGDFVHFLFIKTCAIFLLIVWWDPGETLVIPIVKGGCMDLWMFCVWSLSKKSFEVTTFLVHFQSILGKTVKKCAFSSHL